MRLIKATKVSPHAKFDSLSTEYTAQYLICWPLGRTAKQRFQNKNSCKMRA